MQSLQSCLLLGELSAIARGINLGPLPMSLKFLLAVLACPICHLLRYERHKPLYRLHHNIAHIKSLFYSFKPSSPCRICFCVSCHIRSHFKIATSACTFGMYPSLRNTFTVEMAKFIKQINFLHKNRVMLPAVRLF